MDYELTISDPVLWDVDSPNLYTLCYEVVLEDGTVADCGEVEFGIRTIEVDSVNAGSYTHLDVYKRQHIMGII